MTGGNAGLGYALCKLLIINHGCYVYMCSRSLERGNAAVQKLISEEAKCEGKVEVVQVDVSDSAQVTAAAESVKAKLGENKLYGLINNAGVTDGGTKEATVNTNFYGPKWMTDAFISMIDPDEGRIINIVG